MWGLVRKGKRGVSEWGGNVYEGGRGFWCMCSFDSKWVRLTSHFSVACFCLSSPRNILGERVGGGGQMWHEGGYVLHLLTYHFRTILSNVSRSSTNSSQ